MRKLSAALIGLMMTVLVLFVSPSVAQAAGSGVVVNRCAGSCLTFYVLDGYSSNGGGYLPLAPNHAAGYVFYAKSTNRALRVQYDTGGGFCVNAGVEGRINYDAHAYTLAGTSCF